MTLDTADFDLCAQQTERLTQMTKTLLDRLQELQQIAPGPGRGKRPQLQSAPTVEEIFTRILRRWHSEHASRPEAEGDAALHPRQRRADSSSAL
ncbi:MAG: hypothetical protein V8S97_05120 [Oscillospiraceae bacterium]